MLEKDTECGPLAPSTVQGRLVWDGFWRRSEVKPEGFMPPTSAGASSVPGCKLTSARAHEEKRKMTLRACCMDCCRPKSNTRETRLAAHIVLHAPRSYSRGSREASKTEDRHEAVATAATLPISYVLIHASCLYIRSRPQAMSNMMIAPQQTTLNQPHPLARNKGEFGRSSHHLRATAMHTWSP